MMHSGLWTMGVFFCVCAGLQYNDPDPGLWVLAYMIPALLSFTTARGNARPRVAGVAAAAYLVWALCWNPGPGPEQMAHEAAKEVGGLLIAAGWMAFLAGRGGATRKR